MTTDAPPARCPQHLNAPAPGPCGACGDAREYRRDWETEQRILARAARQNEANERARVRWLAIQRCDLCNADGYINGVVCHHDPQAATRAQVGADLCRTQLKGTR